ncbi:MAG: sel1 repeat family protein [bacterium]|nr:sel1 repeat family protein [bacterium]
METVKQLRKLAVVGDADACLKLGNIYYYGKEGVPQDTYTAFKWYNDAAYEGNAAAKFNLAICYDQGIGTDKDKIKALQWYKKAADAGVLQAKYNMALFYISGAKIPTDSGDVIFEADTYKAVKLLKECGKLDFPPANRELAKLYFESKKIKQDRKLGMSYLLKAVAGKDPESFYILARINIDKHEKYEKIVPLLKYAAENNIIESYEILGIYYETGKGVKQDTKTAFKYYLMAAENGVATAQARVGEYYTKGNIVKENIWDARYWFTKAAEQKEPFALFMLGTFAEQGIGEKQDKIKAFKYFMQSAQLGFDKAQYNLATYYSNGKNISQDNDMAVYWFRKAALQMDPQAQRELGFHYISGEGLDQSYNFGLNWLNAAKDRGDVKAQSYMQSISISPQSIVRR